MGEKNKKKEPEVVKEISQEENIEKLSQKLFGKPSKDIKYLLCTNYIHQQLLDEELTRTGLYQWLNVFNGEVKYPRDVLDYSKYDIVQINMSAQDVHLVNDIREKLGDNTKTKIVLNNDYTTELWGPSFNYQSTITREIKNADMIFGTEYYQATALSELSGRQCYVIPHPADIKRLKSLPKIPKKDIISTIWRRYDRNSWVPSLVTRNHGLTSQLIGFDKNLDPKVFVTTTLYDSVFQGTNYFDFCAQLCESKIVFDPFTFHSYSRTTVDTAAMGVPVVGSDRTQSVQICYPYTKVDPWDVAGARRLIERLLTDEEFYNKVVNTALERSEFYNHKNSKERYLVALDDALTKGKKKVSKEKPREHLDIGRGDSVEKAISQDINTKNVKNEKKNIGENNV